MIPKFRKTNRLISWLEENGFNGKRLPANYEEVFTKTKEEPETVAHNLVKYAQCAAESILDPWQEELIMKSPSATAGYIHFLANYRKVINPLLILSLKDDEDKLAIISSSVGRLDVELEQKIKKPENFVNYVSGIKIHLGIYECSDKVRIPEMEQKVFIDQSDSKKVAEELVRYATIIGKLPDELEDLLKGHGPEILSYLHFIKNRFKVEIRKELTDSLAGDSESLLKFAENHLRKRLPYHLEKTMTDPRCLLRYAKVVVCGRLPEELENHFATDYRIASNYAFEVIRGYACVKLPDVVHTAMIMKSYSDPNDYHVKRYVAECERDTTISGSFDS